MQELRGYLSDSFKYEEGKPIIISVYGTDASDTKLIAMKIFVDMKSKGVNVRYVDDWFENYQLIYGRSPIDAVDIVNNQSTLFRSHLQYEPSVIITNAPITKYELQDDLDPVQADAVRSIISSYLKLYRGNTINLLCKGKDEDGYKKLRHKMKDRGYGFIPVKTKEYIKGATSLF